MHQRAAVFFFAAIVGATLVVAQPSLDPPAGPIAETGRFGTVIELSQETAPGDADSVFRITEPGSYILTGDVELPANQAGIELASDDITLDVNGYTIRGDDLGSNTFGITIPRGADPGFGIEGIAIRNGASRGVGFGIELRENVQITPTTITVYARRVRIDDLRIIDCNVGVIGESYDIASTTVRAFLTGISVAEGSVRDCNVTLAGSFGGNGIAVINGTVTGSFVEIQPDNAIGFLIDGGSATHCTAVTHGSSSVGYSYSNGASVSNCTARREAGTNSFGFNGRGVTSGCTAIGMSVGFVSNDGVIRGCDAINCTVDESAGAGVVLDGNNF